MEHAATATCLCLPCAHLPCLPCIQITEEDLDHAATAMGYGAVKYADLKNHRLTNYKFNYDEMLSMKVQVSVDRTVAVEV